MPTQSTALNTDTNAKLTSAYYADRGDGTSNWFLPARVFNGGDVAQGATTDSAIVSGNGSLIAIAKGILVRKTEVAVFASGAQAATVNSSDVDVSSYRRGIIFFDVTAISATTLNLFWQVKNATLTKYASVNGNAAAALNASVISATGSYAYHVNFPMGSTGRLNVTFASGVSTTFSAYLHLEN